MKRNVKQEVMEDQVSQLELSCAVDYILARVFRAVSQGWRLDMTLESF